MKKYLILVLLPFLLWSCKEEPLTEVFLPKIFGDHMVLQRNQPIKVWGEGTPGKKVKVNFAGQEKETKIDDDGKWLVSLEPLPAGGPYELDVNGKKFHHVQMGDVWLAGGQSNMEWVLSAGVEGLDQELPDSDYPLIRFFKIPHDYDAKEKFDVRGGAWIPANAENILNFSAIAWFFAKRNHLEIGVPIGIIESNWGGTPAEGWVDAEALRELPAYAGQAKGVLDSAEYWEQEIVANKKRELTRNDMVAAPQTGEIKGVTNRAFDDSEWETIQLPRDNPMKDIAWLRKKFNLNQTENVKLNLGDIQQMAYIYLNGGRLFFKNYSDPVQEISVPAGMLQKGENILTLRIVNTWSNAPALGNEEDFYLQVGNKKMSLAGEWKYNNRIEDAIPIVEFYNWKPGFMYNAMIAPIVNYPIKGVIWYQGESNAGQHQYYRDLFTTLIKSWRNAWGIGDFPFLFVQLANWQKRQEIQPDSNWAFLREAQTQTLELPNTAMAVSIDIGDADDIHPRNKKDVGIRLWQAAKKVAYGQNELYTGPMFKEAAFEGNTVTITFNHVGEGLKLKEGDSPKGFIVAGDDGRFYTATAKIVGSDQIEVFHPLVPNPVEVRYAWADNPDVNLYNSADLPAVSFRVKK